MVVRLSSMGHPIAMSVTRRMISLGGLAAMSIGLIAAGAIWVVGHTRGHISPRLDARRVFRLTDGGCVSGRDLPPGWRLTRQAIPVDAISFKREWGWSEWIVGRLSTADKPPYSDTYAGTLVGHTIRLSGNDTPGLHAWTADDGEIVYADAARPPYGVLMECLPRDVSPWRDQPASPNCEVSDRRFSGQRHLTVIFPWREASAAMDLMRQAELAAARVHVTCPGPPDR